MKSIKLLLLIISLSLLFIGCESKYIHVMDIESGAYYALVDDYNLTKINDTIIVKRVDINQGELIGKFIPSSTFWLKDNEILAKRIK